MQAPPAARRATRWQRLDDLDLVEQLETVQRLAVAHFWSTLSDFVETRAAPLGWMGHLAPNHPILRVDPTLDGVRLAPLTSAAVAAQRARARQPRAPIGD